NSFRGDVIDAILDTHASEGNGDDWDFDALWADLKQVYPVGISIEELIEEAGSKGRVNRELIRREILSDAEVVYAAREEKLGEDGMREFERRVVLSTIDRRWRDHLYEMEYLKEGIGLRAMAQRDPLVEYQREGYALFQNMMGQIKEESLGLLYNLEVQVRPATPGHDHVHLEGGGLEEAPVQATEKLSYSAPGEDGETEVRNERGQMQQAATKKAQQRAREALAPEASPEPTERGAFGQQVAAPQNRAERRKKK
ncbi:preprotein translocase subunit SecA, partial [Leucobacter sp. M11]|nr:preprotein translocase subunit SecA [Leucobacter sp. M11]